MIGSKISHYSILEKLGAGGMGEVYRAEDSKLDRHVAIKVLPDVFAKDEERLARFEREAKVLASLNHPNIAAIYGLEEVEEKRFLVMELVEGDTLEQKLGKGELPTEEALKLCLQVSEAIEAAHEKDIIHRDLKPANVKITPEGRIKVLDFGLAKALFEEEVGPDLSKSPTITAQMTRPGVILGTAPYMSPEQAKGKDVDKRTDIWAFGCLLFECLTGKRAFEGDTITEIIASVLKTDPDWKLLPVNIPRPVHQLLQNCLQRDPEMRLQTMKEARTSLSESSFSRWSGFVNQVRTTAQHISGLWWILIVLAIAAMAYWQLSKPKEIPIGAATIRPLTANPMERSVNGASISPDGKYLAFIDPDGLHLQVISSGEEQVLVIERDLIPGKVIKWYPDGTRLLFLAKSEGELMSLWSVSALGGRLQRIRYGVWDAAISPDGTKLAFIPGGSTREQSFREVWLSETDGENPRSFLKADPEESIWNVAWSPDSQRVAYGTWGYGQSTQKPLVSIKSCTLDGTGKTILQSGIVLFQSWTGPLPFVWASDGQLIFSRHEASEKLWDSTTSNIWSVKTNVSKGTTIGEPRRITQNVGSNVRGLSISDDCQELVAYLVRNQADIWIGELNSEGTMFVSENQLTNDEWPNYPTSWSHDSQSLLIWTQPGDSYDIYLSDIAKGVTKPIERDLGHQFGGPHPTYSPDGSYILYLSNDGMLSRIPAEGGPPVEILSNFPLMKIQCRVGSDLPCLAGYVEGEEYVFISLDIESGSTIELLRISHRAPFTNWELSPDGTSIAVVHNNDDTIRIFSVPSGQERTIHVKGWTNFEFVTWSADGKRLFINAGFASEGRFPDLLSVDFEGNATVLRHAYSQWHVRPVTSPDGKYVAFSVMPFHGNAWLITGLK